MERDASISSCPPVCGAGHEHRCVDMCVCASYFDLPCFFVWFHKLTCVLLLPQNETTSVYV